MNPVVSQFLSRDNLQYIYDSIAPELSVILTSEWDLWPYLNRTAQAFGNPVQPGGERNRLRLMNDYVIQWIRTELAMKQPWARAYQNDVNNTLIYPPRPVPTNRPNGGRNKPVIFMQDACYYS